MKDASYDAFRFEWGRPNMNSPNGILKVHCIAVAKSLADAEQAMIETVSGSLVGARLIGRGPDVLAEARQRGMRDGEAKVL
jgi:hypothetical protein